ncbi:MAG: hypothetical protein ACK41Y_16730, partial [Paracoccus hibiscisoli]|uniref:hypothetical protein n=1 Tax=Paracoccus hibiscisoli TaxID=2023261 RepID=UPI00391C3AD3
MDELERMTKTACPLPVRGGLENAVGKVNALLQAYISGLRPYAPTLVSDMNYVVQNAGRIAR